MGTTVKVRNPKTIDVRRLHDAIQILGFKRQDGVAAQFLSQLNIHGNKFEFVSNVQGWGRLRIVCPQCRELRIKLIEVEGDWRCRTLCHRVAAPSRCRLPMISGVEAHYLRPLRLIVLYQQRLEIASTPRQRAILRNKIARLRRCVGEYVCSLYDAGQFPVPLPEYFDALSRVL